MSPALSDAWSVSNAIAVPSGDQAGFRSSASSLLVRFVRSVPSALTAKTSALRRGPDGAAKASVPRARKAGCGTGARLDFALVDAPQLQLGSLMPGGVQGQSSPRVATATM